MALDPKKLKEAQDLLEQINKIYSSKIGKTNPFKGMDPNEVAKSEKEIKKLEVALDGIIKKANDLEDGFGGISAAIGASLAEMDKQNNATNRTVKAMRGLKSISDTLKNDQLDLSKLSLKELENKRDKLKTLSLEAKQQASILKNELGKNILDKNGNQLAGAALESRLKKLKYTEKEAKTISEIIQAERAEFPVLDELNKKTEDRINKEKQINKNLGIAGNSLKSIEGFMNKIGLGALSNAVGFDEINDKIREYAEELEESEETLTDSEKKQKVMKKSFEELATSVKKALTDPLVQSAIASKILSKIFTSLKDGFLKSQENTGNLAKNLNISNKEAMELSSSMSAASFGSDALFLSSKGLTETLVEINKELGTSIQFSVEQLSTFTKLRETAGLTNEELMGINNLSLSNGKTFDKNADTILNQVSSLNRASKIYLNEKQVLKDISKLSSAVTLSLGKNPEALAKALATTKALGLEMSQLESIAGGLLDFESSIENELSAQLLTGKNINMELARQYALNNDYANLAKEINKQIGTSAEFTEMNSIGQEAMAKAVGMTREELAKTLFIQDQLKGASKEEAERRQKLLDSRIKEVGLEQAQKELREGGLDKMLDQATAAEKMAASMSKINELTTALGAMFAPIVNMFASVAGFIMESKLAMIILSTAIGGLVSIMSVLAIKSLISAVASIFKGATSMLGPLGIPIAIAGVGALMGGISAAVATSKSMKDGVIGPDGEMVVSGPKGSIQLDKDDSIIAGTNLFDKNKKSESSPSSPQVKIDMGPTNALLQQLINVISAGGDVMLDGQKVGQALNLVAYKTQ
jgi:hypothetical protein